MGVATMRTKRGGYRHTKPKSKAPVSPGDQERLAAVSGRKVNKTLVDWRNWGENRALEPMDAGLLRILKRRAPRHLWA